MSFKKLLTLLFTLAVAFSLTLPVMAQETSAPAQETAPKAEKKKGHHLRKPHLGKGKKEKSEKKESKESGGTTKQ